MLPDEMWQLPLVMLDATSLARFVRASRAWQRAGRGRMSDLSAAALVIQRSMRRALAVIRTTLLRGARFDQMLHDPDATDDLSDIPINLWAAYHAYWLTYGPEMQHAVDKLAYYGMPAPAPRHYGRGMLAALIFVTSLDIEQLMCLGV